MLSGITHNVWEEAGILSGWTLLWKYREVLWGFSRQKKFRHPYWTLHKPDISPYYKHYPYMPSGFEALYVLHGFELDRLLCGELDALDSLQQRLVKLPLKKHHHSKSNSLQRRMSSLIVDELQDQRADFWQGAYRYWLSEINARLHTYQSHWSGRYDIARCRDQVARYDQAAGARFQWWHVLVGWWQRIAHKRKLIAIAKVSQMLEIYVTRASTEASAGTMLSQPLEQLSAVDVESNDLVRSLRSTIHDHEYKLKVSKVSLGGNVMRSTDEMPVANPEMLETFRQEIISRIPEITARALKPDITGVGYICQDLQQDYEEWYQSLEKQFPEDVALLLQVQRNFGTLIKEFIYQFSMISQHHAEATQHCAALTYTHISLLEGIKVYESALAYFRKLESALIDLDLLRQSCAEYDQVVWRALCEALMTVLQHDYAQLKAALCCAEEDLSEETLQVVSVEYQFEYYLSELLSLLKSGDQRLYDQTYHQSVLKHIPFNEVKLFLQKAEHYVSPMLLELRPIIENAEGALLHQLALFWEFVDSVKDLQVSSEQWTKRYAPEVKRLKQFTFKNKRPDVLLAAWRNYDSLMQSFYELPMPVGMRCRCDVMYLSKESEVKAPLSLTAYDTLHKVPTSQGRHTIGYYDEYTFVNNDRHLSPRRGVLIYLEAQDCWYLQAHDGQGKRIVREVPWSDMHQHGFKKADAKRALSFIRALGQDNSFLWRDWSWAFGNGLSQSLAQVLGEPVYEWQYAGAQDIHRFNMAMQSFMQQIMKAHLGLVAPLAHFYQNFATARMRVREKLEKEIERLYEQELIESGGDVRLAQLEYVGARFSSQWLLLAGAVDSRLRDSLPAYEEPPAIVLSEAEVLRRAEVEDAFESIRTDLWLFHFNKLSGAVECMANELKESVLRCVLRHRNLSASLEAWVEAVQSHQELREQVRTLSSTYRRFAAQYHEQKLAASFVKSAIVEEDNIEFLKQSIQVHLPRVRRSVDEIRSWLESKDSLANFIFIEVLPSLAMSCNRQLRWQELTLNWRGMWHFNSHYSMPRSYKFYMGILDDIQVTEETRKDRERIREDRERIRKDHERIRKDHEKIRRDRERIKKETEEIRRNIEALDQDIELGKREIEKSLQRALRGELKAVGFTYDITLPIDGSLHQSVCYYMGSEISLANRALSGSEDEDAVVKALMVQLQRPIVVLTWRSEKAEDKGVELHNTWIRGHDIWQASADPIFVYYHNDKQTYSGVRLNGRMTFSEILEQLEITIPQPQQVVTHADNGQGLFTALSTASNSATLSVNSSGYDSDFGKQQGML